MNKEIQRKVNEAMREVRVSNRSADVFKAFRCNPNESDAHLFKMFEVWLNHRRLKIPILTEVIFTNGKRADILLPSQFKIIEVMKSETKERLDSKDYPFQVEPISALKENKLYSLPGLSRLEKENDTKINFNKSQEIINLVVRRTTNTVLIPFTPDELKKLKEAVNEINK